jgi:hypothetical protein
LKAGATPATDPISPASAESWTTINAKCDGRSDDSKLINAALSHGGVIHLPAGKRCVVTDHLEILGILRENLFVDLNGSTILFTGTGQGECSQNRAGLLQIFEDGGKGIKIYNGTLAATNEKAHCLLNFSQKGYGDNYSHGLSLDHVVLWGTPETTSLIGLFTFRSGSILIQRCVFQYFRRNIDASDQADIVKIVNNDFEPVFDKGPNIRISGAQGVSIDNNNFEATGVSIEGPESSTVSVMNNWLGDGCPLVGHKIAAGSVNLTSNFIYYVGCKVGSSATGLEIASDTKNASVSGNYIHAPVGIRSRAPSLISGNEITATTLGIYVTNRSDIRENTLVGAGIADSISINGQFNTVGINTFYSAAHDINCHGNIKNSITVVSPISLYQCDQGNDINSGNEMRFITGRFSADTIQERETEVRKLPTCDLSRVGDRASVSDALLPSFAKEVRPGGNVHAGVRCNGSKWTVYAY